MFGVFAGFLVFNYIVLSVILKSDSPEAREIETPVFTNTEENT
jgi:hypothetical protein